MFHISFKIINSILTDWEKISKLHCTVKIGISLQGINPKRLPDAASAPTIVGKEHRQLM